MVGKSRTQCCGATGRNSQVRMATTSASSDLVPMLGCIAASTEHIHHTGVCKGRSSPRPDDQRRPSYGCLNASRDPFTPHTKYEISPKKLMTMPSAQRHFGPGT